MGSAASGSLSMGSLGAGSGSGGGSGSLALFDHQCPRRLPTDPSTILHAAERIHFVLLISTTIYFIAIAVAFFAFRGGPFSSSATLLTSKMQGSGRSKHKSTSPRPSPKPVAADPNGTH